MDKPIVHIEVVRGSKSFAQACRLAAITFGMVATAQASASIDAPIDTRLALAPTPAALKLAKLLPDQTKKAQLVSPEQRRVLEYGIYPAVKTTVRINGRTETQWTMHPFDLVRLAREAAAQATLIEGIRVDPAKVGAVMIAESSMVSRVGWSANGKTPSFGLAQLEERTARSLGVKDLNNPRESALAAARLVAEGQRLAAKNRGVDPSLVASLAYNTSSATRSMLIKHYGSQLRIGNLPLATQIHVKNMAYGEQRMSLFSKLNDLHVKMAHIYAQALASTQPPARITRNQESFMSTPRPSTMSLISGMAFDNANQARLQHNQIALERYGHLQPLPMTTQGLIDLRQSIATQIQRLSNAGNPVSLSRDLENAPMALKLSTMGENLEAVARSFLEKVGTTYAVIVADLKAAAASISPSPVATAQVLALGSETTAATMQQVRVQIQERREQIAAMRDHPGYTSDVDA